MILGNPPLATPSAAPRQGRVTIDDIFRRVAQRRPDALALADAPNRAAFTGGIPRRLSFAQADRAVSAIAGRLRQMGLPTDAVVGIQLPNVAENVLAILGVMRAGMIAAPLPLLWRRADTVAALARVGGKALITCGHAGGFDYGRFAMRVAAEVFSIRYVCGFGGDLPDGVVAFDDLLDAAKTDPLPPLDRERHGNPASHVAAITFDVGPSGIVAVARNHLELLAGGLGVHLESGMAQDATLLSTLAPASFAGICMTLVPWILCGGALLLHHPFDPAVLAGQLRSGGRCDALVLPGAVAFRLAETEIFTLGAPGCVLATWRAPELLTKSPTWRERASAFVDVAIFGEVGLIATRRGANGLAAALPFAPVAAPRGHPGAVTVAELLPTVLGNVGLRGPMVPRHAFPPGAERAGLPHFAAGPGGLIDTGYRCQVETGGRTVLVLGPPSGIVSVGGYRLPLRDLQDGVRRVDADAKLAALPDPLLGQRVVGNAADPHAMEAALNAVGVNPLVAAAFHARSGRAIAARAAYG